MTHIEIIVRANPNADHAYQPLPMPLVELVIAAQYGRLNYPVRKATVPLGELVLKCAARYATGRNRMHRLDELWTLYGVWYTIRAKQTRKR